MLRDLPPTQPHADLLIHRLLGVTGGPRARFDYILFAQQFVLLYSRISVPFQSVSAQVTVGSVIHFFHSTYPVPFLCPGRVSIPDRSKLPPSPWHQAPQCILILSIYIPIVLSTHGLGITHQFKRTPQHNPVQPQLSSLYSRTLKPMTRYPDTHLECMTSRNSDRPDILAKTTPISYPPPSRTRTRSAILQPTLHAREMDAGLSSSIKVPTRRGKSRSSTRHRMRT
jgi:hypothetical protein